jgi:predicted phage terminase large subunit-like protein
MYIHIELPPFHRIQQEVADDNHRFKVISCGRRWGKTLMCVTIGFRVAFVGKLVWWVAPTYFQAGIAWRMAMKLISQIPKEYGIKINIAERTITFPTGGQFIFKSSDRPDFIRGEGIDLLIMDEASIQKSTVWEEILRPALADKKGNAIFIGTPKNENDWFHNLFKQGLIPNARIKSWQFSSYTNPYLDPEELNEIRDTTPALIFRREILAEFVGNKGARVEKTSIKYIELDELANIQNLLIVIGADLAIGTKEVNDYTAVCCMGINLKTGDTYIIDVKRGRWSFAKQKEEISAMADKWNKSMLYRWQVPIIGIENKSYQQSLVQEVSKEVPYAVYGIPANVNKLARFAPLEARYELGQVYHVEGLPLSFESELLGFDGSEEKGVHDDQVDCLSVAWAAANRLNAFDTHTEAAIFVLGGDEGYEF